MSNEVFGLLALAALFGIIFIGFPIAFTLGAVALGTGFIAFGPMVFDLAVLQTFSVMKDTVLASITSSSSSASSTIPVSRSIEACRAPGSPGGPAKPPPPAASRPPRWP